MIVDELMKRAQIAEPCTAKWEEMTGDEKTRLCAQCNLNVHNAREMTDEEVMLKIMSIAEGNRVCMRIYRRADGTFLTKNCPVGVRKQLERARKAAAWLAGGLSMLLSLGAASQAQNSSSPKENGTKKKPVWHSQITADQPSKQKSKFNPLGWIPIPAARPQMDAGIGGGISCPTYSDQDVKAAQTALESVTKQKGADSVEAGRQLETLGMMYYWQQKYPESERNYSQALTVFEKHKGVEQMRSCCLQLSMLRRAQKDEAGAGKWQTRADGYLLKPAPNPAPNTASPTVRGTK
jgi:hypothetical protein